MTHKQYEQIGPFDERGVVEVLVDDTWWPGQMDAWALREDDVWEGHVRWTQRPDGGLPESFLGWVPASRVRPDTVDRSQGRSA